MTIAEIYTYVKEHGIGSGQYGSQYITSVYFSKTHHNIVISNNSPKSKETIILTCPYVMLYTNKANDKAKIVSLSGMMEIRRKDFTGLLDPNTWDTEIPVSQSDLEQCKELDRKWKNESKEQDRRYEEAHRPERKN